MSSDAARPMVAAVVVGLLAVPPVVVPRLIDVAPPELIVTTPKQGPIRGGISLRVHAVDRSAGVDVVTARIDDDPPRRLAGPARELAFDLPIDTTALADGVHHLELTATDRAWPPHEIRVAFEFETDNSPPVFDLVPASILARQGGTLAPVVHVDEPIDGLQATWLGKPLTFYPIASVGTFRALVGIDIEQPLGATPLRLVATDALGNRADQVIDVDIRKHPFEIGGKVRLSLAQNIAMGQKKYKSVAQQHRDAAYAYKEPAQLWKEPWIRPVEGRRSSTFGKFREYDSGEKRHHRGVDIANDEGTEVFAANHGVVTLAELQHTFGEVVILHHGQGVSTSYNHLLERLVKVGDKVRKGQLVGLMGSTGRSTGPHLHWGMEVGGLAVDAEEWLARSFVVSGDPECD